MKIRTQSFILMAGILAMPALVLSLFVVIERLSFEAREAGRFAERALPELAREGLPEQAREGLPAQAREGSPAHARGALPEDLKGGPMPGPPSLAPFDPAHAPPLGRAGRFPDRLRGPVGPMRTEDMIRRFFEGKPEKIKMAVVGPSGAVFFSDIEEIPVGSDFARAVAKAQRVMGKERILAFGVAPPMPEGYSAVVSLPRSEFIPVWLRNDLIKVCVLVLAAILAFAAAMCVIIVRSIARSVLSLEAATRRVAAGDLELPIAVEGSNEITSLSRSLDSLRREIREDQARRARFIMGISHDLKTPLALVKGYAEALEEELGDAGPAASAHLGVIQSKADQLEGMIDDLIDFERVDTGEWSRGLADVELSSFLRSFARRVEADATLLSRELRSDIDLPSGSIARMNERLATRALENLVNNSLRYTSPGDRIRLEARAEAGAYLIVVADEGPGIAEEDLPRIFEPFFRGSSSRREQGLGLGLSIVKTIVETHGWTIEVGPCRDEAGGPRGRDVAGGPRGAAFTIAIPRSE